MDATILDLKLPPVAYKIFNDFLNIEGVGTEEEALITARIRDALEDYLREISEDTIRDLSANGLKSRSGMMVKSLRNGLHVEGGGTLSSIHAWFAVPGYVKGHEEGTGPITPKTARVLTLPMPAALQADGTPKRPGPIYWRDLNTFTYTSQRTGKSYLAYKGPDGRLVLLYVFVHQTKGLQPRLGLGDHYRARLGELMSAWGEIVVQEMARFNWIEGRIM